MAKLLSPKAHGIIDYLSVPLLIAAGPLFHFGGLPAQITSTAAGVVLVYSAATAYPLGLVKMIPFRVHRILDVIVGLTFIVAPFVLRFEDLSARWFFVGYGGVALIVVALTDDSSPSVKH